MLLPCSRAMYMGAWLHATSVFMFELSRQEHRPRGTLYAMKAVSKERGALRHGVVPAPHG